ncbi:MAG: hypothetical protein LBJ67_08685 [Planctomycetaceae bacterium]|jgi:hypothetical protein|nr:hypothetical protein [Planctomycetaceae bacterium]
MVFAEAIQNTELLNSEKQFFFDTINKKSKNCWWRMNWLHQVLVTEDIPSLKKETKLVKDALYQATLWRRPPKTSSWDGSLSDRGWVAFYADLARLSEIVGDNEGANEYIKIATGVGKGTSSSYVNDVTVIVNSQVAKEIDWQKLWNLNTDNIGWGILGITLAQQKQEDKFNKFIQTYRNSKRWDNYKAGNIAYGYALLGKFDQARLLLTIYPDNNRDSRDWKESYRAGIIGLEFLEGIFSSRDFLKKEFLLLELKDDDGIFSFSGSISKFYFNYGRGFARHKSNVEILKEFNELRTTLNKTDMAFFMAGVATGLQDKRHPQKPFRINSAVIEQDQPDENNIEKNDNQNTIVQQPLPEQPDNRQSQNQPQNTNGSRLEKGVETYQKVTDILGNFGVRVPTPPIPMPRR